MKKENIKAIKGKIEKTKKDSLKSTIFSKNDSMIGPIINEVLSVIVYIARMRSLLALSSHNPAAVIMFGIKAPKENPAIETKNQIFIVFEK